MLTLQLTEEEAALLKKSIKHCVDSCKEGGATTGCTDCERLEALLKRLETVY